MSGRNEEHDELSDDAWLLDLGFLTDLTAKLNVLNTELQGKDKHLSHMMSALNAFKVKLGVWTSHLKNGELTHFPNLAQMSQQATKDNVAFHPECYCAHLDNIAAEFSRRFTALDSMDSVVTFLTNPFQPIDVDEITAKFNQVFTLPTASECLLWVHLPL